MLTSLQQLTWFDIKYRICYYPSSLVNYQLVSGLVDYKLAISEKINKE